MFTPPNMSYVMCHVTRQVSHVMCHMSHVIFFFFRQSGEAYRWRVCYQRGLPRLVTQGIPIAGKVIHSKLAWVRLPCLVSWVQLPS